ncbi:MAG: RiPP maturation radical SAM C-methyltransferase [Clostridia bacterium]|nr:RiPP maturation radical SAM C-methyltransferase [Clostridia bacterium]
MQDFIRTYLEKVLDKNTDILFIVTPFASLKFPSIGLHILQAVAESKGFSSNVLYLSNLLAACMGRNNYEAIYRQSRIGMLGERLFSRSAYGMKALGGGLEELFSFPDSREGQNSANDLFEYFYQNDDFFDVEKVVELEKLCYSFINYCTDTISEYDYKIVGCSTMFEQTNSAVAVINKVKQFDKSIVTIIGGANCEGDMSKGISSLSESIDYVFSGESELTFASFLDSYIKNELPDDRIFYGEPLKDFDTYGSLKYDDFFRQLKQMPESELPDDIAILLESSRGCWWGAKNKCTFCGINKERECFRQKSREKILKEFLEITGKHPGVRVQMTDNIMPYEYFNSFVPDLIGAGNKVPVFYEQKANLDFYKLLQLADAGIKSIQPGVESLSTGMLKLLNKGVKAWQNILLLRNARSIDMDVHWNLLWGAPGDEGIFYSEILDILPLISHLQPPVNFSHIDIHRFSSYYEHPNEYNIENLVPSEKHRNVFPDDTDVSLLAYSFSGTYSCGAYENIDLIKSIYQIVNGWKLQWPDKMPVLTITEFMGQYLIYDTRTVAVTKHTLFDKKTANEIMKVQSYCKSDFQETALKNKWAVVVDTKYIPVITAQRELMIQFEQIDDS